MASIKQTVDKSGNVVYKITANHCGKRITKSWRPNENWSAKTVQRELQKYAANLELGLASGELQTRREKVENERLAAIEAAKLKTVWQYANGVYMATKSLTFSENTRASYQMFLDKYIFPALGDCLLTDVSAGMISKLLVDFQRSGKAHASAIKLYNILNGIFEMAYLDDSIKVNPMLKVQRPKPGKAGQAQTGEAKALTADQLSYVFKCAENEPLKWKVYVHLLADTGMRRSEAVGVQWSDIDWAAGTVTIRRTIEYTPQAGVYQNSPKNGRSRTVDLGSDVLELLHQLRTDQAKSCISRWVFTQDGSPDVMHPDSPTRYFTKFGKKYGIAGFHPHLLRHSSASISILAGADVVSVSERLGHSDTSITLRLYSHSNEEAVRRAGNLFRDAIAAAK